MKKKGFTLIELLVVIAVLAVLAAGVIVAINPGKRIRQANDAKIKNDIGQLATGLQAYY
ncbi:prepilin-type N-terminal cleavage/methylation domain-containing protein, partial [Candidatus Gottesmanbacteria bacterium]|nr:prepilin-type N-terminal cleavage/methylation domain-containing protein [Candidatus Gottesmanbacteria bacterium]